MNALKFCLEKIFTLLLLFKDVFLWMWKTRLAFFSIIFCLCSSLYNVFFGS